MSILPEQDGWRGPFSGGTSTPPDLPYARIARGVILAAGIVLLLVVLNTLKNVYVDWLWFDSLGYKDVYVTRLTTRVWLFFAGAGVFAVAFAGNILLARRLALRQEPAVLPPETIVLIQSVAKLAIVLIAVLFAIIFGVVASGQWENLLRLTNAQPFLTTAGESIADPLWGHNPSFYALVLPVIRFVQTWLMGLVLLLIIGSLGVYGVAFSLQGFRFNFRRAVGIHLAILGALLALAVGWSYWLDINELVLSQRGLGGTLAGANATDATAKLFGLRLMLAVTVIAASLGLAAGVTRNWRFAPAAFGLWIASAIIFLAVVPALYQRLQVQPSELARETPYIEDNIAATRQAYGIDAIDERPFPTGGILSVEQVEANATTIDNVRLWDHRPLRDTLNQIQFLRPYYTFTDVDVDRYTIDGQPRQVMLSARELAPEQLPEEAHSWVAQRLQYTHGYGLAMSPVNEFTPEGRPEFLIKDVPPVGVLPVDRPEIYYGERTKSWVAVNTKTQEFSYPNAQGAPVFEDYEGTSGVPLGSFVRRLALSWKFTDFNLLISGELNSQSRILYYRDIQERISKIAPFLRLDADPYLVLADGKMWWMQDAYTVTERYPYSFQHAGGFNYIRNSVKVVVDAYDGTVIFYQVDKQDAIVNTYAGIFPGLFQPFEAMPPALRAQVRYPEGLFNVQEEVYRLYHVTDPRVFFTREDTWSRPSEIFYDAPQPMEAYYLIMRLPGEAKEEFVLLLPFTPLNKPNLVAWLAARSDGENYGKLVAYTFPKDKQVDGPQQVEARINNDPLISQQFTLWGQQGSKIIRGNLLVIPMETSLLYVEPIYLQASSLAFPELKRVVVAINDRSPAMETSLERALAVVLGQAQASGIAGSEQGQQPPQTQPTPAPTSGPGGEQSLDQIISQLQKLLDELKLQQQQ